METDNIDYYKGIEYRYLGLVRDCTLSKEFLPQYSLSLIIQSCSSIICSVLRNPLKWK